MRVDVDDAGSDDQPVAVEGAAGRLVGVADADDAAVADADVGAVAGRPVPSTISPLRSRRSSMDSPGMRGQTSAISTPAARWDRSRWPRRPVRPGSGRDHRADLYESYRTLRDEHPVYEDPDGRFVALTRFADVAEAATDAATYSSEITANTTLVHPILAQLDPPRHTAMRRLILRAFTASRVAERETEIRAIAVELLDRALQATTAFDLIGEFAALLPSIVMGRLIGIPDELIPTCREISDLHMRRISQRDALVPDAHERRAVPPAARRATR